MSIFSHPFRRSFTKPTQPKVGRGFTLIELLVVMSVMVVVTGAMLVKQSRFNSSTILRSLAYSVALSVRQAQVYGTSVVGTTTASTNCTGGYYNAGTCYASAFGLYFDASTPDIYVLFADLNNDGKYQSTEYINKFKLNSGYIISSFCANGVNGASPVSRCSGATINTLNIIFKRPNPDANFTAYTGAGAAIAGDVYSGAYIQIQTSGDSSNTKSVSVSVTGEVSVCSSVGC